MQNPDHRDGRRAVPRSSGSRWVNVALVVASGLLACAGVEWGYRTVAGLPLLEFVNWRADQVVRTEYKAISDPVLGWTLKPWSQIDGYTTIDYGIRPNEDERTLRTGGILAVGDSFTQGWDVDDDETWPAYLEKFTDVPVVNAGIGGYGTDQIILRAEALLPVVQPKILIVGFLEADIFRAGHSVFGAPKPYFTQERGELRYHAPELAAVTPAEAGLLMTIAMEAREALGYSAAANFIMTRLAPNYWHSAGSRVVNRKAGNNPVDVTCALLRRLKAETASAGIPMSLFMQHHAPLLFDTTHSTPEAQRVVACAEAAGIRVVDQFASLRAIAVENPDNLVQYYVGMYDGAIYGHMTARGNEHAASLLAPAVSEWLPAVSVKSTLFKNRSPAS